MKRGLNMEGKVIRMADTGKITLYHGSIEGIRGELSVNMNKSACDFGKGFYTGNNLRQAENRVANNKNGKVYTYECSIGQCNVYKFTDDVLWALFIGYNRGYIKSITPELRRTLKNIEGHEVIVGKIADDKISMVFNDFMSGNITDKCLSECLKLVKYGEQYVFKTDTSLQKSLTLVSERGLTKQNKIDSIEWGRRLKINMEADISDIKIQYRRTGRFIDECLEDYK